MKNVSSLKKKNNIFTCIERMIEWINFEEQNKFES